MLPQTKEQALEYIANKVEESQAALREAEMVADKFNLYFYTDGPSYGMGGSYNGEAGEWLASSLSC